MRLYIFGPMLKYRHEGWNRQRFEEMRATLAAEGHEVCSPMVVDDGLGGPDAVSRNFPASWLWALDLQVIGSCQGIVAVEEDWGDSTGSRIEAYAAMSMRLPIYLYRGGDLVPMPEEDIAHAILRVFRQEALAPAVARVAAERRRQEAKWGQQNHPDGTGLPGDQVAADQARQACEDAHHAGKQTYRLILDEEYREALAETDPERLVEELVQVAAVACGWVEAIRRRTR